VIVLDTGAWIWWVSDPTCLSRRARGAIAGEERTGGLRVSTISIWEVALKNQLGKLTLDRDLRSWVALATSYPGIRIEPLTADDALESVLLPGDFHRDPADRFIVALARRLGVAVVTSDRRMLSYRHVKTIW
jgi:PIN domain nuclease of toxin-antitoxin system